MTRLKTRAEQRLVRSRTATHAAIASTRLLSQTATVDELVAAVRPGWLVRCRTADLSLAAVAAAAARKWGGELHVWSCSGSLGYLEMLPRGTHVYLDESMRRRLRNPTSVDAAGVVMHYGKHHTKGFVIGDVVCESSCNLSRGCGVEHYALFVDQAAADEQRAWLATINSSPRP